MGTEERVLRLENAFSTLVELARTQSERMDEYEHRSEEYERRSAEYERRSDELAEAQKQTQAHISVLAEIMADLGRAQTRTEVALTSLTERFEQYISSRS
jgi:chromosome segregation ATPase